MLDFVAAQNAAVVSPWVMEISYRLAPLPSWPDARLGFDAKEEFRKSTGTVRQYQTIYLMGVLAGYGGANAALIDRNAEPLYCEPPGSASRPARLSGSSKTFWMATHS